MPFAALESATEPSVKIGVSAGTIRAAGEFQRADFSAFKQSFDSLCASPCRSVFVDLTRCPKLNSMFIGELADAVVRMKAGGKDVHVEVSHELGKQLQMARLFCLFDFDITAADLP